MEAERDVCVWVRACRGWHVSLWGLGKWCPVTSTNAAVNYYSHKFIPRSRLAQGLQLESEEGRVTGEMLVCVYIFLFEASSHSLTVIFRLVWWNAHIDCMTKQQELGKSQIKVLALTNQVKTQVMTEKSQMETQVKTGTSKSQFRGQGNYKTDQSWVQVCKINVAMTFSLNNLVLISASVVLCVWGYLPSVSKLSC